MRRNFIFGVLAGMVILCLAMTSLYGRGTRQPAGNAEEWLPGPSGQWFWRIDTALSTAQKENKKLLLLKTGSDWCGWCRKLYNDVLSKPEFTDFARKNLVLVYLDFPMRKPMPELQQFYNGEVCKAMRFPGGGYPGTAVFDAEGGLLGNISGYKPLEAYMESLRTIVSGPVKQPRKAALPGWLRQSPEELRPMLAGMLEKKKKAAAEAARVSAEVKKQSSFKIVAWGLEKEKVDRPFDPERELRAAAGKEIFVKVRYTVPQKPRIMVFPRMPSVATRSSHRGLVSGDGEFTVRLFSRNPVRRKALTVLMRVPMPEAGFSPAAVLSCPVAWE